MSELLPLAGASTAAAHAADDVCITCGDVAVPLEVVEVDGDDARCRAEDGGEEVVALELVADVRPGDRLLVHAKVALDVLERAADHRGGEA